MGGGSETGKRGNGETRARMGERGGEDEGEGAGRNERK